MIDRTRNGKRVKICHYLRTAFRTFDGHETGTILYEIQNGVGKRLIEIEWDGIGQSPVFDHEIVEEDSA